MRRRPASPSRWTSSGSSCSRWSASLSAGTSSSGRTSPASADGLGQSAAGAADDGDAVRHGVERRAGRGLDPARGIAGGHDDDVEPGPDLVHRGPGKRAEPGDPSGDAQPLGESLELLLRGARADHGDGPAADDLDRGAKQQVEPLLVDQPADESDRQPGVGRRGPRRAATACRAVGSCGGAGTGGP